MADVPLTAKILKITFCENSYAYIVHVQPFSLHRTQTSHMYAV